MEKDKVLAGPGGELYGANHEWNHEYAEYKANRVKQTIGYMSAAEAQI